MKLCVNGEVRLKDSVTLEGVCAFMRNIQNIKIDDDTYINMKYRNHVLSLKTQCNISRSEFEVFRQVMNELSTYLSPNSYFTINNSDNEYTVKLYRRATPLTTISERTLVA